jgi:hypothetical protein
LEKTRRTSRPVNLFFGKAPRTWKKQADPLARSACFWQGPANLKKTRRTSRRVSLFLAKSRELEKNKANLSPGRLIFGKVPRTWKNQGELLAGSACFWQSLANLEKTSRTSHRVGVFPAARPARE